MTKYWAMAPAEHSNHGRKAARYNECWAFDHTHGVIAIGWDLGEEPDSPEHLDWLWEAYARPEWRKTYHGLKMLRRFWFEVDATDMVVAKAGLYRYVGVGEFQSKPFYDPSVAGLTWGCSLRRVLWNSRAEKRNSPVRFTRSTLYSLRPDQFRQFQ